MTVRSLAVVITVSLVGGIAAALVGGGSLRDLGSGAGGLFGIPSILTTLIALLMAIPAAVAVSRQARRSPGWLRAAVVTGIGAGVVAIGYFVVAHAVDPVSTAGGTRAAASAINCSASDSDQNSTGTLGSTSSPMPPASVLLGAYLWAIRRWGQPGVRCGRFHE